MTPIMMKINQTNPMSTVFLSFALGLTPVCLLASEKDVHWSYEGEQGPTHWGELSDDYHRCLDGKNQSPINIESNIHADLPELVFEYYGQPILETNNGHTIQLDVESGSFLRIPSRNDDYELKQFHFHSPSEHNIQGQSFAMEMHFVHSNEAGRLAVVGVLFVEGQENPELGKLWGFMPEHAGESNAVPVKIEETKLLPPTREYFYYSGSLTTPPCSEGVVWIVLKTPIEASAAQIALFKTRMGPATNRPVQPHNARIILN
jgi:carbonic anhydrase